MVNKKSGEPTAEQIHEAARAALTTLLPAALFDGEAYLEAQLAIAIELTQGLGKLSTDGEMVCELDTALSELVPLRPELMQWFAIGATAQALASKILGEQFLD